MVLTMFAVRDLTANFYFPPFFARSQVEATRIFERLLKDPNRMGSVREFDLVLIGEFDDQTGVMAAASVSSVVANGSHFEQASA